MEFYNVFFNRMLLICLSSDKNEAISQILSYM